MLGLRNEPAGESVDRELKSATDIQAKIFRLVPEAPDVKAAGASIIVPLPKLCDPDSTGCNWTLPDMGGSSVHHSESIQSSIAEGEGKVGPAHLKPLTIHIFSSPKRAFPPSARRPP